MESGPGPRETRDRDEAEREPDRAGERTDERGGYLGFVAHEVRNPLSTALWSAELLARMPAAERGGPRGEKLTAMCLRSLGRVRQLVEDHFMCERLEVSGLTVRNEPVDLREVLDGIASRRTPGSAAPDIHIESGVSVEADRVLLDRTLDALVALASRENAPVRIEAESAGDRLRVVVRGHPATSDALDDPRKGSPGEPRGRALAGALARRAAEALGATLAIDGDAFVLTLASAAYTPPAA